jgi:pyridoxal phosphate enzyme (YggS family)
MTPVSVEDIARRRAEILARIAQAASRRGRNPADVALMAVTKTQSAETVANAARAGITLVGENRVQEAAGKIDTLKPDFPGLEWHLIGPLQTNKAKTALQCFQAVESVDRERLAVRLEALLAGGSRVLPVLLEINVGAEGSKSGTSAAEAEGLARAVLACPHLALEGLMAVPPYDADPERARPHFAALRALRDRLVGSLGRPLPRLSMGMSHDFAVAVEEGSTQVRVGTALFGPREAA